MSEQWYYAKDGQQIGPVSEEDIKDMIASGDIAQRDLIWREGMDEWIPASQVFPQASSGMHEGTSPKTQSGKDSSEMQKNISIGRKLLNVPNYACKKFLLMSFMSQLPRMKREVGQAAYEHGIDCGQSSQGAVEAHAQLEEANRRLVAANEVSASSKGIMAKLVAIKDNAFSLAGLRKAKSKVRSSYMALGNHILSQDEISTGTEEQVANARKLQQIIDKVKSEIESLHLGFLKISYALAGVICIALIAGGIYLLYGSGEPPYADLVKQIVQMSDQTKEQLLKEYNVQDIKKVPSNVQKEAMSKLQAEFNEIMAGYDPLPVSLDDSCDGLIEDIEAAPPTFDPFLADLLGAFVVPVKFTVNAPVSEYSTNIICKVYDNEGLLIDDDNIIIGTSAEAGERIAGRIRLSGNKLAKACALKIFIKNN